MIAFVSHASNLFRDVCFAAGLGAIASCGTADVAPFARAVPTWPEDASSPDAAVSDASPAPSTSDAGSDAFADAAHQQEIAGNIDTREDCDTVCLAHGMNCTSKGFGEPGIGGMSMTYGSDGGKTCGYLGYCFDNPEPTYDCFGVQEPLASYKCACVPPW